MSQPTHRTLASLCLGSLLFAACSSDASSTAPDGATSVPDAGPPIVPVDAGGAFPEAPALAPIEAFPNRDSVRLLVPAIDGARDYRAFALVDGVEVVALSDGTEDVEGATVFCAGQEQHNLRAEDVPRRPLRWIEVWGITEPTQLVVEALDRECPFAGVSGAIHVSAEGESGEGPPMQIHTEDEIRARYGSVIVNGQAPAETLGAPAPRSAPRVLARSVVQVSPLPEGTATPTQAFFEDWSDDTEPLRWIESPHAASASPHPSLGSMLWQNDRWNFLYYEGYPMTAGGSLDGREQTAFWLSRGAMHTRIQDWGGNFGSQLMIPRRTVDVGEDDYLHVTYEVDSNTTQRRYWWLGICGDPDRGQTVTADGQLQTDIILAPFFYERDGSNPTETGGRNADFSCLQIFTLYSHSLPLPPTDTRSEADIPIILSRANQPRNEGVVQLGDFHREVDANGTALGPLMDDRMLASVRTRFDVYVRRDRVVIYIEGRQRICTDFPSTPYDAAESVVAFGNVFYHSGSDRYDLENRGYTAQRHYLENLPWVDQRTWDNLGFDEHVAAPPAFDESRCGEHRGSVPAL